MDSSTVQSSEPISAEQLAAQQEAEQRRLAAKQAHQERRRKLIALGPQFVEVIKLGQAFVRFTEDTVENVFVWFDQDAGRSGCLCWEPLLPEASSGDASASLLQPKVVDPERTLKFSSISDIYMGRSNAVLKAHGSSVNTKLCITFAAHAGTGDSLHVMARSRPQMEAWIYGIQHILKQGGFQFVEANEQADKRERAIFEQYSAKQLVRLIMKKDPSVAELRLQATLTHINRGQSFTRYLPNGQKEDVFVFFCSDGGKGTLFWGHRSKPDGYLPLRTVTDMWLGKHGLLTQDTAADVDPAHCMSLASKKAMLAIEAPSKAVMTQWVYGIHSLLTASPDLLQEINQNQPQQRAQPTSATDVAAAEDAVRQLQEQAAASSAVDGDAAFQAEAAAALAALRNLSLVTGAETWTVDEIDMSALDQEAVANADAVEEEAEKLRLEFEEAIKARQQLEQARKAQEEATKRAVAVAGDAAANAIAAARALREAAEARAREAAIAVSKVLERAEEAYGGESGLAETMELQEEEEDEQDEEEGKKENNDVMDEEEDLRRMRQPRGRRLSLFSSLELDEDVRNALTFDIPTGNPSADNDDDHDDNDDNNGADVEYTGAEDDNDDNNSEAYDLEGASSSGATGGDADDWTTLNFDMDLNTDHLNADNLPNGFSGDIPDGDGDGDGAVGEEDEDASTPMVSIPEEDAEAEAEGEGEGEAEEETEVAEPVRRPIARRPAGSTTTTRVGATPASTASSAASAGPRTPISRPTTATRTAAAGTTASSRPVSAAAKSAGSKVASTPVAGGNTARNSVLATPRSSTAASASAAAKSAGTKSSTATAPSATPKRPVSAAAAAAAGIPATPVRKSAAATGAVAPAVTKSATTARTSAAAAASTPVAASTRVPIRKPATKLSIHMDDVPATPVKSSSTARPTTTTRPTTASTTASTSAAAGTARPKSSAATGAPRVATAAGARTSAAATAGKSAATKSASATGAKK